MPSFDILISGAGPAGSTLALMLARRTRQPGRIALIGRGLTPSASDTASSLADGRTALPDPRALALNHGSRSLLESLGAWPSHSADIHTVHVSQDRHPGRCLIDDGDLGVPRLGSVVAYPDLLACLHRRLADSGITLVDDHVAQLQQEAGQVCARLSSRTLQGQIGIQSDGHPPRGLSRTYHQHALLATVLATQSRAGWAYERFTAGGPLALLPHPADTRAYSVVWCCTPGQAQELRALPGPAFDAALQARFGERLGRLGSVGERAVFPLALHVGTALLQPRVVAIGNAAQTLHPVAGQGLNLGLRDVAQLAQTLSPWLAGPDDDPRPVLQAYAQLRRPDRWLTAAITDTLPRVFTTGNSVLNHACGLALTGLDLIAPARHLLARHLLQGLRR
ncbi:MAG: FAD-dependent monooxygenase [Castellaniella sp.]